MTSYCSCKLCKEMRGEKTMHPTDTHANFRGSIQEMIDIREAVHQQYESNYLAGQISKTARYLSLLHKIDKILKIDKEYEELAERLKTIEKGLKEIEELKATEEND